jgi:hypothetical protein
MNGGEKDQYANWIVHLEPFVECVNIVKQKSWTSKELDYDVSLVQFHTEGLWMLHVLH